MPKCLKLIPFVILSSACATITPDRLTMDFGKALEEANYRPITLVSNFRVGDVIIVDGGGDPTAVLSGERIMGADFHKSTGPAPIFSNSNRYSLNGEAAANLLQLKASAGFNALGRVDLSVTDAHTEFVYLDEILSWCASHQDRAKTDAHSLCYADADQPIVNSVVRGKYSMSFFRHVGSTAALTIEQLPPAISRTDLSAKGFFISSNSVAMPAVSDIAYKFHHFAAVEFLQPIEWQETRGRSMVIEVSAAPAWNHIYLLAKDLDEGLWHYFGEADPKSGRRWTSSIKFWDKSRRVLTKIKIMAIASKEKLDAFAGGAEVPFAEIPDLDQDHAKASVSIVHRRMPSMLELFFPWTRLAALNGPPSDGKDQASNELNFASDVVSDVQYKLELLAVSARENLSLPEANLRANVFMRRKDGKLVIPVGLHHNMRNLAEREIELSVDSGVAGYAFSHNQNVIAFLDNKTSFARKDGQMAAVSAPSITRLRKAEARKVNKSLAWIFAAPLMDEGKNVIGVLTLDYVKPREPATELDRSVLVSKMEKALDETAVEIARRLGPFARNK